MIKFDNIYDYILPEDIFTIIISLRGNGKTYSALAGAVGAQDTPCMFKFNQFLLMRRLQNELDTCVSNTANPFSEININNGLDITVDNGNIKRFMQGDIVRGYAFALSTMHNVRGLSLPDVDLIIYDEFIPMPNVRPIKNEDIVLLHAYETINRNRELIGKPPVRLIMLANAYNVNAPILKTLGIVDTLYNMLDSNETCTARYPDRGLNLTVLNNQEIIVAKHNSALGKLTAGTSYTDVAIDNKMVDDDIVHLKNMLGYRQILQLGDLQVWEHKSTGHLHIKYHKSGYNDNLSISEIERHFKLFDVNYRHNSITYDTAMAKNKLCTLYSFLDK